MALRVLVLNDGSKYENWGIKACIDGLNKILNSSSEDVEVIGLSHEFLNKKYNYEPKLFGRKILNENSRVASRFFKKFHIVPNVADEFEFVSQLWLDGLGGDGASTFIKLLQDVDVVVFNGEGSVYRKNFGAVKGLFMLWFSKVMFNKPSYFINGSVTLTSVDSTLPAMINKVFSIIDGVSVREPFSLRNVMNYFPGLTDIQMYPDSVFSLGLSNNESNNKIDSLEFINDDFFCFSLSMLPMDFSLSKSESWLVKMILEVKKIVPNAVLLAKDVEDQLLKNVAELTDSYFVGKDFSYQDVAGLLSRSKFLLSGRYHHIIFASKVGCPSIPFASSSHKIHGLVDLFSGFMPLPKDPTNLHFELPGIINDAQGIIHDGGRLREKIRRRSGELAELSSRQGEFVCDAK